MKKDTYYFSHDANARNDVKCIKLRRELGLEGYGIFWTLIEILRDTEDNRLPITSIEDIAYDLHVSKEKIEAVIFRYELFQIENEMFFSMRLSRSVSAYKEKKKSLSEAGVRGNAIRWASGGDREAIGRKSQLNKIKGKEIKGKKKYILPPSAENVKAFYEKELADNENAIFINNYRQLVQWLYGGNEKGEPFKNVLSLPEQITYKQFTAMKRKSEETGVTIKEIINEMENRKQLVQNNISASLTAMNWMARNSKDKKTA